MDKPDSAYLVMKNIPHAEWSFRITQEHRVIGRSSKADIPIPARFRGISRRHLEVWSDKYGLWIRDLGSSGGTKVNGVWIDHASQVKVVIGDTIWIGGTEIGIVAHLEQPHKAPEKLALEDEETPVASEVTYSNREFTYLLRPAELDVLLWISRGYEDPAEIAQRRHRSAATVQTEIAAIYRKLGVHSRSELMAWIKRSDYTPPPRKSAPLVMNLREGVTN